MRIRTIKPEFWRSDDITALSREDRLLFIGLWSYVDDNGVGVDDYRQIAADLFALEDDQKEIRDYVREALATLSRGFLIARYEVSGKRYLHITNWKKHQRVDKPNRARYPEPPDGPNAPTSDDAEPSPSFARDSRETRETPATGTEEQRNRGVKNSRSAALAEPPGFADFYEAYPRKRERKKALTAYRSAVKAGAEPERLLQAATSYARQCAGKDITYVKYPASWLNAGAYDDEPEQPALSLVPAGPASFEDLVARAAATEASRLLGIAYIPAPQPPSDTTPPQQWLRDRAVEFIDAHEQELRAALTERKTG